MFESEVSFVELHRTVQIGDMDRHVVDSLEHCPAPTLKDRPLSACFATARRLGQRRFVSFSARSQLGRFYPCNAAMIGGILSSAGGKTACSLGNFFL
jgi:hypothetical protein